ncbi:2-hydroxyglutaryl-CoA dehydratase [Oscillibacter sp. MSJ-2]|uniref:2-hydroxyglutaryl-CoA dehydratase n=1 Tax=Dysosmobacter acutus TaxID=2841504 RepID=A0ABS6FEM0_9FIRM|nr:(R)-2-hydroxyglutaryl-CoA dehydratase activase HgdC [Dysosmobacter acutus]MBU5628076.1 2-hydroxyglutaryl-CoA dehydratase [Dysosmobacter acutus]
MYTMGIDVGSTASKCIVLKDGQEIVGKSLVSVGAGTSGPARAIREVLENCNMKREDMGYVLATGYGRNSLEGIADQQMSELSCHARGAYFLFPKVRTVIDIGGQDVKILEIENGMMVNFAMNDKCAAGTGRFLDVMARVLEVKVEDLAPLGAQSTVEVGISSTCTVFAESEVISQLAKGTDKRDIINGIHRSVASRVVGLAHRIGVRDEVVMTGGVAQNYGVVNALQKELGHEIYTSPLTQYNGALGAALFAYQRYQKEQKA